MLGWLCFRLMDIASLIDRGTWSRRRLDWFRGKYSRLNVMSVEQWLDFYHDGWRPARFV